MKSINRKVLFLESGLAGGSVNRLLNLLKKWPYSEVPYEIFTFYNKKKAAQLLNMQKRCCSGSFALPVGKIQDILKNVGPFYFPTWFSVRYFYRSLVFILCRKYGVIYLNNTPRSHLPVLLVASLFQKKIICHLRDTICFTRAERFFLSTVKKYIVLSYSAKEHYISEGIAGDDIEVVYDSIDLSRFNYPADVGSCKIAVVIGTLCYRKGQDNCLRSFKMVLEHQPEAQLVFIGDGEDRERLKQLSSELGVESAVTFLGHREDIEQQLSLAGIGILSSRREGFPNSVMEYMAAGLPVLVSELPGIRELVEHGVSGLIHGTDDVSLLAEHWLELLGSAEKRKRMGEKGREIIQKNIFSPQFELQRILKIVRE